MRAELDRGSTAARPVTASVTTHSLALRSLAENGGCEAAFGPPLPVALRGVDGQIGGFPPMACRFRSIPGRHRYSVQPRPAPEMAAAA